MQIVIAALLVVIVLVLLGLFGPMLYGLIVGIVAVAPAVFTVAGVFLVMLVGLFVWHAAKGNL